MPAAAEATTFVHPAHLWVPDHVTTAGGEAAELAESVKLYPDPEQRLALDTILAETADGRWAAFEGAIVAPRQNIKTFVFLIIALADLFVFGTKRIVWSAHEYSTAQDAFLQVQAILENFDHLRRRVRKVSEAHGEQGVILRTGQQLQFKARTKSGGRGLSGDRVILDEAFALRPSHMGSLMPIMSARTITGNPQLLYGSSAGDLVANVLRSIRNRGRAGGDPFLAYLEWCAAQLPCVEQDCSHVFGLEGCQLDNEALWGDANLAVGRRISIDFLRAERRSLPPEEFAKEIMGWWEDPPDGSGWELFDPEAWSLQEDRDHRPGGKLRYALDADTNAAGEEWFSVGVSDGIHIEDVTPPEARPGHEWVVPAVVARKNIVGDLLIDPSGPAGRMIGPLKKAGVGIQAVKPQEFNQACMYLHQQAQALLLKHLGQHRVEKAVGQVVTKDIGDGAWRFSRTLSPVDISGLNAIAMACWASQGSDGGSPLVMMLGGS